MSYDDNFRPKAIPKRMNQRGLQSQVDKSKPGAESDADPILADKPSNTSLQPEGARTGDNMIDRPKGLPKSLPDFEYCAAADASFS